MEVIIVGLIVMAISTFFSNKKNSEEEPASRNVTDRRKDITSRQQGSFKKMEDYAKGLYGEFQAQMNPDTTKKEQLKEVVREKVERPTSRRPERERAGTAEKTSGRLSVHQNIGTPVRNKISEEKTNPFPLTQSEAQKAIILAEVFMPPKAKRK